MLLLLLSVVFSVSASLFTVVENLYLCVSKKTRNKQKKVAVGNRAISRKENFSCNTFASFYFYLDLIAFGTMITPKSFLPYAKQLHCLISL